ncbi:hypothetical protein [Brevibacillus sp. H7]|uniref:hypothetical protein n=1 Tax=Brevibacillus sp. H7 TaxID=3349138 RepID=UPI003820CBF2
MVSVEMQEDLLKQQKETLISVLQLHRQKPYLPVWGELFCALRDIAQTARRLEKDVAVYAVHPVGMLWYRYREATFIVDIPDPGITISLTGEQLIDSLMQGRFSPLFDRSPASASAEN